MRLTTTLCAHNYNRFRVYICSTIYTQRAERAEFRGKKRDRSRAGDLETLLISSTVAARDIWCSELIADINELTYVYVTLALFSDVSRGESTERVAAKDDTARQTRRTKEDSNGTGTLRDRWLMKRVLRCFIRSVRRSGFSKLQPLRALAFAGRDHRRSVHPRRNSR